MSMRPVVRNLYEPANVWLANARRYWPGARYVLAETNTAWDGRVAWLRDLRAMLDHMPWVRAMWSQLPSRGQAHRAGTSGLLNWDARRDARPAAELRGLIEDGGG